MRDLGLSVLDSVDPIVAESERRVEVTLIALS